MSCSICRHCQRFSCSGPDVLTIDDSGTAAIVIFVDDAGVLSSMLPVAAVVHVAAIVVVPGK